MNSETPLGDVYFDLDESKIRDDAKGPLQRNADWMKRWTTTQVSVEGNTDERGSAEYNLGWAHVAPTPWKQYLVSLGVSGNRITVVSARGRNSRSARNTWRAAGSRTAAVTS